MRRASYESGHQPSPGEIGTIRAAIMGLSKRFFFEKKNQKTSVNSACRENKYEAKRIKVFWFFFLKKHRLLSQLR
jgi:hypothetical protein